MIDQGELPQQPSSHSLVAFICYYSLLSEKMGAKNALLVYATVQRKLIQHLICKIIDKYFPGLKEVPVTHRVLNC